MALVIVRREEDNGLPSFALRHRDAYLNPTSNVNKASINAKAMYPKRDPKVGNLVRRLGRMIRYFFCHNAQAFMTKLVSFGENVGREGPPMVARRIGMARNCRTFNLHGRAHLFVNVRVKRVISIFRRRPTPTRCFPRLFVIVARLVLATTMVNHVSATMVLQVGLHIAPIRLPTIYRDLCLATVQTTKRQRKDVVLVERSVVLAAVG